MESHILPGRVSLKQEGPYSKGVNGVYAGKDFIASVCIRINYFDLGMLWQGGREKEKEG